ncbi:hypothetical protein IJI31_04030 [bacterium]|nr:hypothetical protein [bacterium]
MFEKFTEKAINAVYEAQNIAAGFNHSEVRPEHLLCALSKEAKGISLKLVRMYGLTPDKIENELRNADFPKNKDNKEIVFSKEFKDLLKKTLDSAVKSGNNNILFEHLFLSAITYKGSKNIEILEKYNFDICKSIEILSKLVEKKIKRMEHPEVEEDEYKTQLESVYEGEIASKVFERAVSKLSAKNYEILGTEQIVESILEDKDSDLVKILNNNGINLENFDEKLMQKKSREAEYDDKKIVFTPNAFRAMNTALQIAKELGSSVVLPEHIILAVLKTGKGIASDIFKELYINSDNLEQQIIKPIERQMPETLRILRLAKEEARRIGKNVVGTEMFLLGIIEEGAGIGATVLNDLEITLKDTRNVVEKLVGFGDEYFDKEITYTKRAKRVLERAWKSAKSENKIRIGSDNLLMAIVDEPTSLAMKVLEQLGVDAVEIKYGILKEKNKS